MIETALPQILKSNTNVVENMMAQQIPFNKTMMEI